jgi:hypothetical protein
MALDPITAGMDLAGKIIERIFPDRTEQEKAKLAMMQLQETGALQREMNDFNLAIEQIKVNAVEAASGSRFVAGWRPFIGWVCGFSLFYNYIFFPLYAYTAKLAYAAAPAMPALDNGQLISLLMALLGLGAMRSYEKVKQFDSPNAPNPAPVKPGA